MKLWVENRKRPLVSILVAGVLATAIASTFSQVRPTEAAPYLGCSPNGYIVKDSSGGGGHTDIQAIDMVTGAGSSAGQIQSRELNAIGYNPKDNHFYAWDLQNGVFVKVSSDFATVTPYTAGAMGYAGPTTSVFAGDVDEDGYHWSFTVSGGTTTWYRINLNTATPTFVESGTTPNPTGTEGTDWAYVPGTNKLYRGMDNGTDITIVAFDRTTKTYSTIGTVTNITAGGSSGRNMGAVYADPNGNFYMSSNGSGILWRVDLDDPSGPGPTYTAVQLDAADVGSNDGARCVLASVPTDYGDAPDTYSTLIGDDGPRHNVVNFEIFESTAPLMLGKKVDIENDGFPNVDATGDDADHEGIQGSPFVDDERGVTHIVATPGSSDPLVVPAYVTNASGQNATLVGWIDLDNDGVFEVAERVSTTVESGFIGYKELTFPAPSTPYSTNTFSRFRLFSASDTSDAAVNMLPTGPAAGGEVEDVLVQVGTYDVNKTANPAEGSAVDPGQTVTYTISVTNTGATALTNLKIDDDLSGVLDDAALEGTPTVDPTSAGTATVNGDTLEFVGDVGIGQTVNITYAVKINAAGSLGDTALNNVILATHSASCHPTISDGQANVSDPDCSTSHTVSGLANTGSNLFAPLLVAGGFIVASGVIGYFVRKQRAVAIHK